MLLAIAVALLAQEPAPTTPTAPTAPTAGACPAREVWPGDSWTSRADEVVKARGKEIAELEKYAFTLEGDDAERKGIRTDALLIIQGGQVVYEKYARGFSVNKRHLAWSVSKSLTSALTGVAVKEGALSVDDSICKYIDGLPQENCAITVEHLLEMSSGLDWKESYEKESNQMSSVLAMLYGQGSADAGRFDAMHHLRDKPGTSWMYSSGETTLLADVVGKAMKPKHGDKWPWPAFFQKIGMRRVALERDAVGTFIGASYWYASARDAARLGYLYLNDGCWKGERILPAGWVASATELNPAFKNKRVAFNKGDSYGRLWWLNKDIAGTEVTVPMPDVPADAYAAEGHWGQSISVIPSLDMIVVRFADDREHVFDLGKLLPLAIAVGKAP